MVSQYSTTAQDTIAPLLLKSKGSICQFLLVGLVPGLPWPSSRCGKWSVNSLQICCGWGGPWALAGRNVTWTPLQREAALRDGAFMHIVSGPNRKLTQQFKGEPAGENVCWRQWSCGGFLTKARLTLVFCSLSYHSWYSIVACSRYNICFISNTQACIDYQYKL